MAIKIHDLAPAPGSTKRAMRVGRGTAGKGGKTAGRGTKGQKARRNIKPGREGGQTPLYRRLPKLRGFTNPFRVEYFPINLRVLQGLADGGITEITPETLREAGLIHKNVFVKILGAGELSAKVNVKVHAYSDSAKEAITKAGGTADVLDLPFAVRPPAAGNQFQNR